MIKIAILSLVITIIVCAVANENFDYWYSLILENGITPSGFTQLDAEDFDDIGLTKFGKKIILKTLAKL